MSETNWNDADGIIVNKVHLYQTRDGQTCGRPTAFDKLNGEPVVEIDGCLIPPNQLHQILRIEPEVNVEQIIRTNTINELAEVLDAEMSGPIEQAKVNRTILRRLDGIDDALAECASAEDHLDLFGRFERMDDAVDGMNERLEKIEREPTPEAPQNYDPEIETLHRTVSNLVDQVEGAVRDASRAIDIASNIAEQVPKMIGAVSGGFIGRWFRQTIRAIQDGRAIDRSLNKLESIAESFVNSRADEWVGTREPLRPQPPQRPPSTNVKDGRFPRTAREAVEATQGYEVTDQEWGAEPLQTMEAYKATMAERPTFIRHLAPKESEASVTPPDGWEFDIVHRAWLETDGVRGVSDADIVNAELSVLHAMGIDRIDREPGALAPPLESGEAQMLEPAPEVDAIVDAELNAMLDRSLSSLAPDVEPEEQAEDTPTDRERCVVCGDLDGRHLGGCKVGNLDAVLEDIQENAELHAGGHLPLRTEATEMPDGWRVTKQVQPEDEEWPDGIDPKEGK